jgi:hypothetical protein
MYVNICNINKYRYNGYIQSNNTLQELFELVYNNIDNKTHKQYTTPLRNKNLYNNIFNIYGEKRGVV